MNIRNFFKENLSKDDYKHSSIVWGIFSVLAFLFALNSLSYTHTIDPEVEFETIHGKFDYFKKVKHGGRNLGYNYHIFLIKDKYRYSFDNNGFEKVDGKLNSILKKGTEIEITTQKSEYLGLGERSNFRNGYRLINGLKSNGKTIFTNEKSIYSQWHFFWFLISFGIISLIIS